MEESYEIKVSELRKVACKTEYEDKLSQVRGRYSRGCERGMERALGDNLRGGRGRVWDKEN